MEDEQLNKGWICPKCGQVYAPHVDKCETCKEKPVKESTESKRKLLKD